MLEAIWENSSERRIGKAQRLEPNSSDTFKMELKETTKPLYSNQFDDAPQTTFGKHYTQLNMGDHGLNTLLSQLSGNHANKALFLAYNNISDQGLVKLAQQLKNDQIIQHLILSHNSIQISEFAKAALSDLLKINRTIGWLVFGYNNIHDQGLKNLTQALQENKSVKHLVLTENKFSDDSFCFLLDNLHKHPNLESLFVAGNNISEACLSSLKSFIENSKTIKRIDVRGIKATTTQIFECSKLAESKNCQFHYLN
jgi:hypothetical protein